MTTDSALVAEREGKFTGKLGKENISSTIQHLTRDGLLVVKKQRVWKRRVGLAKDK